MKYQKGLVLCSGGLDSAVVLKIAQKKCKELVVLSFDYGQKHKIEIENSKKLCIGNKKIKNHIIYELPLNFGSSLTDKNLPIPENNINTIAEQGIPSTYVPSRNLIFLSIASGIAALENCEVIYTGVNAIDYSGYPDCRPAFIKALNKVFRVGTKQKPRIIAPLQKLSKKEIILLGTKLKVNFGITHSCYNPQGDKACGKCDSCLLRKKGFEEAKIEDPTLYVDLV